MFGALLLFEDEFIHVVAISFTALILTELIMVALTIRTWHWLMIIGEFLSLALYILSLLILKDYFGKCKIRWFFYYISVRKMLKFHLISDAEFLKTGDFMWKTASITAISCVPLYVWKFLRKKFSPAAYQKLS